MKSNSEKMQPVFFAVKYMEALFWSVYLFLFGFLSSKHRPLLNQIWLHFGLFPKRLGPGITKKTLSEILSDSDIIIRLAEVEAVDGNVNPWELAVLAAFIQKFKPKAIFEIGTFDGRTTLNFALNSPPDSIVYTLDLPEESFPSTALPPALPDRYYMKKRSVGSRYRPKDERLFPERQKIIQLYGDSATFDFSPYAGKIDMVFIDGAHSYEYVLNDSHIALKLLRAGKGFIFWHDYYEDWARTAKALKKLQKENPRLNFFQIQNTTLVGLILK